MNLDTIEKLDRRAKRFNTTNPMPADEVSWKSILISHFLSSDFFLLGCLLFIGLLSSVYFHTIMGKTIYMGHFLDGNYKLLVHHLKVLYNFFFLNSNSFRFSFLSCRF